MEIEQKMVQCMRKRNTLNLFGVKEFLGILDDNSGSDLRKFFQEEIYESLTKKFRKQIFSELNDYERLERDEIDAFRKLQSQCNLFLLIFRFSWSNR